MDYQNKTDRHNILQNLFALDFFLPTAVFSRKGLIFPMSIYAQYWSCIKFHWTIVPTNHNLPPISKPPLNTTPEQSAKAW